MAKITEEPIEITDTPTGMGGPLTEPPSPPPPKTEHPPFVYLHYTEERGLVVESNLDPIRKKAFLDAAVARTLQQVLGTLMPTKPALVKPNGIVQRLFGRS